MKRFIILITMALTLCATNKAVAYDFEVPNADNRMICYNIIDGTTNVEVTCYEYYNNEYMYTGAISIPSTVTYNGTTYSVTRIGAEAFQYCRSLTSVTIPNSVTSIGNNAFFGCSGLASVTIPNSVTSIGYNTFYNCSGLTSISIPNSVTSIGDGTFYNCSGLTSISIPNSVTSIGDETFYDCNGLTSISIPNSVTSIGGWAFHGCSSLNAITIGNSVTRIGDWAFYGCSFPSIDIPNSVTHIGVGAFAGCNSLMNINVEADNTAYSSLNGVMYDKLQETIVRYPGGRQGGFTIPNTVTTIGDGAFNECGGLTSVTIPNSVTTIEHWGLIDCTNLDTVICLAQTPPALGDDCFGFGNNTPTDRYLFVPCNYREAYLQSSAWGWYFESDNIIGEYMTLIEATVNAGTDYTENGFTITNIQENATYTQTLIASDGCDSVIVLSLTVNVGLEEANGEATSAIGLFPNPAEDFATLTLDNLNTKAELVIFDIQGKAIIRKDIAEGESEIRLDLSNLAAGTYSVRITSSEGVITRKLIRR